jgi:hypothetical protein
MMIREFMYQVNAANGQLLETAEGGNGGLRICAVLCRSGLFVDARHHCLYTIAVQTAR